MMNTAEHSGACRPVTERAGNKVDENNIPILASLPVGMIALPLSLAYDRNVVRSPWLGRCLVVDPSNKTLDHGTLAVISGGERCKGGFLARIDVREDVATSIHRGSLDRIGRTLAANAEEVRGLRIAGRVIGELEAPMLIALAEEMFNADIRADLEEEAAAAARLDADEYIRVLDSIGHISIAHVDADGNLAGVSQFLINQSDGMNAGAVFDENRALFDTFRDSGRAGSRKVGEACVRMHRLYVSDRSGAHFLDPHMPPDVRAKLDQWRAELRGA